MKKLKRKYILMFINRNMIFAVIQYIIWKPHPAWAWWQNLSIHALISLSVYIAYKKEEKSILNKTKDN